jgi:hypothetical protein
MALALGRRLLEGKDGGGYLEILESLGHVATSSLPGMIFETASTKGAVVQVTLETYIQTVLCSNLGRDSGYPH